MKQKKKKGPCWKGYEAVGMKMKDDRKVPNCVPVSDSIERIGQLLSEKVMPDTAAKMKAARKKMGGEAAKQMAILGRKRKGRTKQEQQEGGVLTDFIAGERFKDFVRAGRKAKANQKKAEAASVKDSVGRIGDLITEVKSKTDDQRLDEVFRRIRSAVRGLKRRLPQTGGEWANAGINALAAGVTAAGAIKAVDDRFVQPYGQPDNVRYDLKSTNPENRWERSRRFLQGDDYADDWDIQAMRKVRQGLGTRNWDQDLVWGAHDLVTGRDREKELETREKLKPALFAHNNAMRRSLATRGTRINPTPRSGINPKMLYQKEQIELTKSFDRISNLITEVAAWKRKEGKNPEGGLNKAGVESYRRENPGSKLKTAVTTKPSKLKKGSKSAKRRKSFCARMGGMKRSRTSAKTANDPDSRINKSLRKWNC